MLSEETLTSSSTTSDVAQPIMPILSSCLPNDTPLSLESTMKAVIPFTPSLGLVLANTII